MRQPLQAGQGRAPLAGGDDGKVDVGLGDFVDVIGPGVERDVQHDLDHLRVVVARGLDGVDIVLTDMAALARNFNGETYGGVRNGVVRGAIAVGDQFRVVELREIFAEIGVSRQAIAAAVEIGDGERDTLARRRRQSTLIQRA